MTNEVKNHLFKRNDFAVINWVFSVTLRNELNPFGRDS